MYSALQLAKKYLQYYRHAANAKGHGVHSPFMFHFIKFIKNKKEKLPQYAPIENLRKALLQNRTFIAVEDFGAGSAVLKTNERRVDRMAASSLKPRRFAQLLYRMVAHYQPKTIVELGTSFGITTAYLASAHPMASVYTLEGSTNVAGIAVHHFEELSLKNIKLIPGDFARTLPPLLAALPQVDFAFVDGNHRKVPTLQYFEMLLQKATPESIFVFDDIHWSEEMEAAWHQIKQHDLVTLSIDLFFIGIVFFRNDFKEKMHYSIRF